MEYYQIIRMVRRLDFIRNEQTADAAVKDVLGILASKLSEEHARKLAEKFPDHLALDRFGGYSKSMETISVAEYIASICPQFKISVHQARTLVRNVLYFTKEATGDKTILDMKKSLPVDWAEAIHNA